MSRARELAKLGGSGQQVIAGLSSHVGVSTFASDVFMFDDLTVSGNLNVTGDLSYDEVSARNQNITGITTTQDFIVTRNASVAGILTATKGVTGNINSAGVSTVTFLQATNINASGIATAPRFVSTVTTGTAPFTVASTTVVSNLNADQLDGQHAPSGTIVGTTDTQTLTNKTLTSPTLTTPTLAGSLVGLNATGIGTVAFLQATTANVSAAATFGGDVTVTGNLTVNGTTTNINSTNLVVEDKNIVIADVASPTDVTADGGGITLKGTTDKTLTWVDATDAWTSSEDFNLVTGKQYEINGTAVLTSSQVLGKSVPSGVIVGTTDTQTLTNKTISGSNNTLSNIANASLTNSTISGVALGSNLNTLTISTGLSGSSYNGSGAVTIAIDSTVCTLTGTQTLTNKTIGAATISGALVPNANNTIDLGSSANRWANVYSNDLDLSNEGGSNSIDGTWGSYLVQEGEEHLYIINRRSGKKFRFVLEEV